MRMRKKIRSDRGFSLIELMVTCAVILILSMAGLMFRSTQSSLNRRNQTTATRDRIVMGVRSLAGSPAALRNSMRALGSDGATPVNKDLLACAGGNPVGACVNGTVFPMTLYFPVIFISDTGTGSIQPLSSPTDATSPIRFDTNGAMCSTPSATCALILLTSFTAQCPPHMHTAADLDVSSNLVQLNWFDPVTTCTVADTITVNYKVEVDPTVAKANSAMSYLNGTITGSVTTAVTAISGNDPDPRPN